MRLNLDLVTMTPASESHWQFFEQSRDNNSLIHCRSTAHSSVCVCSIASDNWIKMRKMEWNEMIDERLDNWCFDDDKWKSTGVNLIHIFRNISHKTRNDVVHDFDFCHLRQQFRFRDRDRPTDRWIVGLNCRRLSNRMWSWTRASELNSEQCDAVAQVKNARCWFRIS